MVFTEHEIKEMIQVLTEVFDIISLYYVFIFNLLLWVGAWIVCLGRDANPIAPIALAVTFVGFFPREWLVWLHNHDHVAALPGYPYTFIAGALLLSYLPWRYIVRPAIVRNDKWVQDENTANAAHREASNFEGGVKDEDEATTTVTEGGIRMRKGVGLTKF
mmetsp:Transcript_59129/g.118327  ORF Transcript_59129/g.118327 Transcript_59129/m.118327 type:complete len:161 (-) Transcript_59129:190-672(-)|eukprot:CAMPEP_0113822436 /NCGR_PEP_ID=MMETSP0328-20130328/2240_1 /TAXON_ID=39455 /ORGANISM="Alexandrium minutum" /LENGTH=160 /DNA_ID=CAMNT_0000790373 /DNA_START=86 /DNA_END=568 /DNA_ORIENTATION=+ /assembly_acc=CAM_ASM_000350